VEVDHVRKKHRFFDSLAFSDSVRPIGGASMYTSLLWRLARGAVRFPFAALPVRAAARPLLLGASRAGAAAEAATLRLLATASAPTSKSDEGESSGSSDEEEDGE
jgi:hypothetical protein